MVLGTSLFLRIHKWLIYSNNKKYVPTKFQIEYKLSLININLGSIKKIFGELICQIKAKLKLFSVLKVSMEKLIVIKLLQLSKAGGPHFILKAWWQNQKTVCDFFQILDIILNNRLFKIGRILTLINLNQYPVAALICLIINAILP